MNPKDCSRRTACKTATAIIQDRTLTRCIRSGCCAEKKEEPLDWEGESEQTAKPFGWKRGLAAILAAAVMLAAGVCGSLAAIGPRYCGEITIAQFAANFNRSAS